MKQSLAIICCVLLSARGMISAEKPEPSPKDAQAKEANLDPKVLRDLDIAMLKQVERKHVSGVIGLIARHGKVGYFEAFGHRVIERNLPMTKDTLFRIYSMTKPMVAVTAMSLWEEGKFKLDDPISKQLPEWKNITVRENGKIVPPKSPITPRQLMTHSSGLSYDKKNLNLGPKTTLEEFSKSLAKKPLNFQPGTDYQYGYSIDILGRYIEAITGKSLDQVMQERLFNPLKMKDTGFWVPNKKDRSRVAHVYTQPERGTLTTLMRPARVMVKPPRMMGGQGLISTAGDYAKFCQMLLNRGELNGKRVLKKETVELMFQNHLKKIGKAYGLGGMADGKGGYYWGGAAGTKFWIDSNNDSYGVFMIQRWGYRAPTFPVFRGFVDKAMVPEKKDS